MAKDLTAKYDEQTPPSQLSWKPAELVNSIKQLAGDVETTAVEASDWYMAKRKAPAVGARWSRILAIAFVTLGGLAPLVQSTFGPIAGPVTVTGTGIGYLSLALAAACVALDRYAGFSSSWMRRVTTAQAIKRLVVEFRVQWPQLLADVEAKSNVTIADVKPLFDRVAKLAGDVEDLIKEETRLWKVEFESAFAQLEKATQTTKTEASEKEPKSSLPPPAQAPIAPPRQSPPAPVEPVVPITGAPHPPAAPPPRTSDNRPLPADVGDALLTPPSTSGADSAALADSTADTQNDVKNDPHVQPL